MEFSALRRLWQLLQPFHRRGYQLMMLVCFYELLKLAPAAVLAIVIDQVLSLSTAQIPFILLLIAGLLGASMIVSVLDIVIGYESATIGFQAEAHLLKRAAEKLLSLPLGFHEKHSTGSHMHLIHRGCEQIVNLIFFSGKEVGPTIIQLFITTAALLWAGWIPSVLFIAFLPVFFILVHWYGVSVQQLRRQYHEKLDEAAGMISERVFNVRTVQDSAAEERELERYGGLVGEHLDLMHQRLGYQRRFFFLRDTALNIARVVTMGVAIWLVIQGGMTPGQLVFFITLTEKAYLALFRMTNFYDRMGDSAEAVRRLSELLDRKEHIPEKENAKPVVRLTGHIDFQHIHFSYDGSREVLSGISFTVEPKTMVAIIGRSGAGKSTIVKLLYRHFDVSQGSILVDGTDVRDYRVRDYRRRLATVPQEIEIFNSTVLENIAYAEPEASRAEVERAAAMAYAHEFIEKFPSGYDTFVGEKGVKLSGGQKQRIGIARALLMQPSILIFDEATSSLDTESEQLIQQAMREISDQFTMIVIAHRLSTIEHADLVIVLEDGAIAEMGSHEDLMAHRGIYEKMRHLQRLGEVRD